MKNTKLLASLTLCLLALVMSTLTIRAQAQTPGTYDQACIMDNSHTENTAVSTTILSQDSAHVLLQSAAPAKHENDLQARIQLNERATFFNKLPGYLPDKHSVPLNSYIATPDTLKQSPYMETAMLIKRE